MEAGDCYVVVCLNEDNVDHLISSNSINVLRSNNFEVVLPPHLRARKCIVIRGIDKDIQKWTEEEMKLDLEARNEWAQIEAVYKMRNIPHMAKIRFQEIAMAKKACDEGLAFHQTHLATHQIEMEEFIPLTPCWNCYQYSHSTPDCPRKDVRHCSECASLGHTFRDCTNKDNPHCLNCDGNHRTCRYMPYPERITEV